MGEFMPATLSAQRARGLLRAAWRTCSTRTGSTHCSPTMPLTALPISRLFAERPIPGNRRPVRCAHSPRYHRTALSVPVAYPMAVSRSGSNSSAARLTGDVSTGRAYEREYLVNSEA
jgi:hypothetical protein